MGIKIMTSHEPLRRGEWMMMIMKVAIISYFTLGNGWIDGTANGKGLFYLISHAGDEIADMYMTAQDDNDPVGMCRYKYKGANLLSERSIQPTGRQVRTYSTADNNIIKMTVWDYLDCKIFNILSFSSCDYTISGLIVSFLLSSLMTSLFGAVIFLPLFMLSIIHLIYMFLIFRIIFKFIHLVILSSFLVAIVDTNFLHFLCCFGYLNKLNKCHSNGSKGCLHIHYILAFYLHL